ncbi:MAG: porin, partial [Gammaproteobacteria bacterium]
DQGIQLFDTFKSDTWEHSYAILYGNGGVNKDNRDGEFDTTVYWSSEKVFGGKGPWRDHMKFYLWNTDGKRTLYDSALLNTAGTSQQEAEKVYDRKLTGVGFTYQRNKYRLWGEYIKAEGMIFNGSTGGAVPGALNNAGTVVSQFTLSPTGESDGGYIDFGYKVTPKLELDIRYDWYNRVTNLAASRERKYETTTLGMQYWFNRKSKLLLNYEIGSFEAPALAATHAANQIADSIDGKISAQVFMLF